MKLEQEDFEGEIYREVWDIVSQNKDLLAQAKPKSYKKFCRILFVEYLGRRNF